MDNLLEEDYFTKYPRRSDKQYTDIENFNNYEFTNNIIYELAIRNKQIQKLIKDYISCWLKKIIFIDTHESISSTQEECLKESTKLTDHFIDPINLYLHYHFFEEELDSIMDKHYEFQDISNNINSQSKILADPSLVLFPKPKQNYNFSRTKKHSTTIYDSKETNLLKKILVYKENNREGKKISRHEIFPVYSRPSHTSFFDTGALKINLDLNLPLNELTDFIQRLKIEHNENNIPNLTISKLLNHNNYTNELSISKAKRMANMLFAYDYITLRLEEISKNEEEHQKEVEQIQKNIDEIINNNYISEEYKHELIKEEKSILKNDKPSRQGYTTIAKEDYILQELNQSSAAIEKYYEDIRPLIDDMQYKELIKNNKK